MHSVFTSLYNLEDCHGEVKPVARLELSCTVKRMVLVKLAYLTSCLEDRRHTDTRKR